MLPEIFPPSLYRAPAPVVNTTTQDTILKMVASPYRFHLGGSRRMNAKYPDEIQVTTDTDWDFYTQDSPYVREWLEQQGFHETPMSARVTSKAAAKEQVAIACVLSGMSLTEALKATAAEECDNPYTLDDLAAAIYQLDKVQVVLRTDVELYQRVFESIPAKFYRDFLWKSSKTLVSPIMNICAIFNQLYVTAAASKAV